MTKNVKSFFDENSKIVFIATVIMMIVSHGFGFVNLMYSHDSLSFCDTQGLVKICLGRWMYSVLASKRLIATPWLMGVLSIIFLSFATVLVTKTFEFNKYQGICVAIVFSANITLTDLFAIFIFDADADCLAALFACLAVYLFYKLPRYLNILVPMLCLVMSLSLYQAYLCLALGLFLLLIIFDVKDAKCWKDVQETFILAIREAIVVILAMAIYLPLIYIVSSITGIPISTGVTGPGSLGNNGIGTLIKQIPGAYSYFIHKMFDVNEYNTVGMVRMNLVIVVLTIVLMGFYAYKRRKFGGALLLIVPIVLIMPLALNAIYVVALGGVHQLMIFAFNLFYLLPLVLLKCISYDNDKECIEEDKNTIYKYVVRIVSVTSIVAAIFIGGCNVIYSNGAYVYEKLIYDNTSWHAQKIWADVNNLEGFDSSQNDVYFMGDIRNSKIAYHGAADRRYKDYLTGANPTSITYEGTAYMFYYSILGSPMNIYYNDSTILQSQDFVGMPVYPQEGYCKLIDGKAIVKLSDL